MLDPDLVDAGRRPGQISIDTRHLIPDAAWARSEQPVVNRSKQVAAHAEEIQDEAVDREKSLRRRS